MRNIQQADKSRCGAAYCCFCLLPGSIGLTFSISDSFVVLLAPALGLFSLSTLLIESIELGGFH